jgi:hypothetical protein
VAFLAIGKNRFETRAFYRIATGLSGPAESSSNDKSGLTSAATCVTLPAKCCEIQEGTPHASGNFLRGDDGNGWELLGLGRTFANRF